VRWIWSRLWSFETSDGDYEQTATAAFPATPTAWLHPEPAARDRLRPRGDHAENAVVTVCSRFTSNPRAQQLHLAARDERCRRGERAARVTRADGRCNPRTHIASPAMCNRMPRGVCWTATAMPVEAGRR
jgi:hypothetical protein